MISAELQSQLRAKFNPDGSELRIFQLRLLDMLKYIDDVCRRNNIHYWLSSGTCLGAIRHGGFIPWDDDADVEMLYQDYKKFLKAMRKEPNTEFVFQTSETDPEYVGVVGKLRDLNSEMDEVLRVKPNYSEFKYKGVFVDVFAVEPSNSRVLTRFAFKLQVLFLHFLAKIKSRTIRRFLSRFNSLWLHGLVFPVFSLYGKIFNKQRLRHKIGSGFPAVRYLDEVKEAVYVPFEDTMLPVPRDYDAYLTRLYGNYKELKQTPTGESHLVNVVWK